MKVQHLYDMVSLVLEILSHIVNKICIVKCFNIYKRMKSIAEPLNHTLYTCLLYCIEYFKLAKILGLEKFRHIENYEKILSVVFFHPRERK